MPEVFRIAMKAVILAAGEGSRMRPLTFTTPKPLIEVAGKPILEWIIEAVRPHIDGVVLIVGHLRAQIEQHFGAEWQGLPFAYVHQAEQRGTGHALQLCRQALTGCDRFFVIYGDNISAPVDMANCAEHPLSALAIEVPDPEKYGIFKTDTSGRLLDLIEKPKEPVGNLANAGVYVFDQRIFEELDQITLSQRGELELTDAVLGLARRAPIQVVNVEGHWLPIGYRDDIDRAEPILLQRAPGPAEDLARRRRTILAMLGTIHGRQRRAIAEAIARGVEGDRPLAEGRMGLLALLRHLIGVERMVNGGGKPPAEHEMRDLGTAQSLLDAEREKTIALVRRLDAAALARVTPVTPPDVKVTLHFTFEELLHFLAVHQAWHGGQMAWTAKILGGVTGPLEP